MSDCSQNSHPGCRAGGRQEVYSLPQANQEQMDEGLLGPSFAFSEKSDPDLQCDQLSTLPIGGNRERRAKAARRSSRLLSPKPQLQSSTTLMRNVKVKITIKNPRAATLEGSWCADQ